MSCQRRILDGRRDLLAPAASFPERYPCLLESVVHGTAQSRYDILFAFPRERLSLHADGQLRDETGMLRKGRFLDALDHAWQAERLPPEDDALRTALDAIRPDELSPRDALEALYQLKKVRDA